MYGRVTVQYMHVLYSAATTCVLTRHNECSITNTTGSLRGMEPDVRRWWVVVGEIRGRRGDRDECAGLVQYVPDTYMY